MRSREMAVGDVRFNFVIALLLVLFSTIDYGQLTAPLTTAEAPLAHDHAMPAAGADPSEPKATGEAVGLIPTKHNTCPWPSTTNPLVALVLWICADRSE